MTRRVVTLLAAMLLAMAMLAVDTARNPAHAQVAPAANPDLAATCGIDLVILMDSSGSISGSETEVLAGYNALLGGLANTGSRAGVVDFDTDATVELGYTEITTASIAGAFATYAASYTAGGLTNWQAAFQAADSDANYSPNPALVVIITDGDPTTSTSGDFVAANLDDAIAAANPLKTTGTHILAIGVAGPTTANLVVISGPDVVPPAVINVGTVSGVDVILASFDDLASALALLSEVLCSSIDIDKEGTIDDTVHAPSGVVDAGDEIDYTFDVTNDGSTPLSNINVTDPLVAVSCPNVNTVGNNDAFLDPLETIQCTATYTITQADVDAGSRANTATAQGTAPLDTVVQDQDQNTETITPVNLLDVSKAQTGNADEDDSGDVTLGDTLTFTITATNEGNTTLSNVVVSDPQLTPTGGTTPCASVAPHGTCTLVGTHVVTVTDADIGFFDNTGTAGSDDTDPVDDDLRTPVEQDPDITLVKTGLVAGGSSVGDTITYTFKITNSGNVTLSPVLLVDPIVGFVDEICGQENLAPGEMTTCIGTYDIDQDDLDAGKVDNTATVSGNPPSQQEVNDSDTESVTLTRSPALSVSKELTSNADEDQSSDISLGDTLTFTVTATNTGNVTLNNVVVTDDKITPTGGTTPCASVAVSATCTLVGTYKVTQADVNAGEIVNKGSADSDESPPDDDTVTTSVSQKPAVEVDKSPDNQFVDQGQNFTWTITVTNTGNVALTDVAVTDALVPGCDAVIGSLAIGASSSYTCTVTDVQNLILNVAAATGKFGETTVNDSDASDLFVIAAAAAIGDTVWLDEDGDGIEDPGEPGVANVDVTLFECLDPACSTTVLIGTTTTNSNGIYNFLNLEIGDYLVVVDTTDFDGDLTTAGQFIVPLGSGTAFLNADFGVEEVLPVTGIDSDRLGWFGLVLLAFGGMLILGAGRRRKEN